MGAQEETATTATEKHWWSLQVPIKIYSTFKSS